MQGQWQSWLATARNWKKHAAVKRANAIAMGHVLVRAGVGTQVRILAGVLCRSCSMEPLVSNNPPGSTHVSSADHRTLRQTNCCACCMFYISEKMDFFHVEFVQGEIKSYSQQKEDPCSSDVLRVTLFFLTDSIASAHAHNYPRHTNTHVSRETESTGTPYTYRYRTQQ